MHSEVSCLDESCTVRYPGSRSHTQGGILTRGVMRSEVSWLEESCTVRYPVSRSHAQGGSLARGVMHSEVSYSEESCTARYILARGGMRTYLIYCLFCCEMKQKKSFSHLQLVSTQYSWIYHICAITLF